jgi:hypothetical protein
MGIKSTAALLFILLVCSCSKPEKESNTMGSNGNTPLTFSDTPTIPRAPNSNVPEGAILVDASRDGGVWWYPQAGSFSATMPHQGKALADYLRSLGFTVDELPRGTSVTWDELKKYKNIIRAVGFGTYTSQEIAAYDSCLQHSSSLLLLSDHLQNSSNDGLSAHLGLVFSGSLTGAITPFPGHNITAGVGSLPYIAGSVIMQPDPGKMTILGYARTSPGSQGYAAMGVLLHPGAKIFFIGDANGIEQVLQPFTSNLVKWLFQ